MRARRGRVPERHLADGPGKLCQALAIDRALNGIDLTTSPELFVEDGVAAPDAEVTQLPRVGVVGNELALARPWRFLWQPASSPGDV